jgi:hypothetical protein
MITKIVNISSKEQDKDGNSYMNKQRFPQARVSIQIDNPAYEDKWLSYFDSVGGFVTKWARGEEHDIEIKENGQYLNFKPLKQASQAMVDSLKKSAGQYNAPVIRVNEGLPQPLPHNEAEVMKKIDEILVGQKKILQALERIEYNENPLINLDEK